MAQPAVPADSYARYLLAPELVMAHQADINLTNDQRTRIATEMANAQSKFVYRQWLLANVEQVLEGLLKGPVVDETAVLKRTEEILLTEQDMKKIQMSLLVRVKNVLTPDQQAVLFALRPLYEAQGSAGQAVRGGGLGGGGRAMGSGGAGGFIGGGAVGGGTRGGRGGMLDTLRNPPPR
jgi:Spy/CpxP family protein refolding chaperone